MDEGMDKDKAMTCARAYVRAVTKEFKPEQIWLFGSYANGVPDADSDIDVAVIFNGLKDNWLDTYTRLSYLTLHASTYIEPHIFDRAAEPNGFIKEIFKTGTPLYTSANG